MKIHAHVVIIEWPYKYRIAENFRGRKLSQIDRKGAFRRDFAEY